MNMLHPIFDTPDRMARHTALRALILSALVVAALITPGRTCAQQSRFDIWRGDRIVGSILARRTVQGESTSFLMTSYAELNLVGKQVVRTTVAAAYRHGHLSTCYTQLYVNENLRDSSRYMAGAEEATCYVHPDDHFAHAEPVVWTTARMYFDEPVGQRGIFVESVMRTCPMKNRGPGHYQLTLPGGKVNTYRYENGVLSEIHVDRNFIDLVFKRDG